VPSPSSETVVTLPPDVDLHARPAAQFVRAAMGFRASIAIAAEPNGATPAEPNGATPAANGATPAPNGAVSAAAAPREVDAKSLLSVLSLGARRGTRLRLRAEGDDAALAVGALADCLAGLTE
jgi:phosphocarrier protein HPr